MLHFAREFDFLEGTSAWHIFDKGNDCLRVQLSREVEKGYDENVLIYPSSMGLQISQKAPWTYSIASRRITI